MLGRGGTFGVVGCSRVCFLYRRFFCDPGSRSLKRIYAYLLAIMSDEDGKVNGKFPIFDDLLAFMWCKINVCPCETLLNTVKSFYKVCDITKARDTFDRRVPDDTGRRIKRRKAEDMLKQLYELMQGIPTEDPPVFVAIDLNNLPFIDLKNIDGAVLVSQQKSMKQDITAVRSEQEEMRRQLEVIQNLLEGRGSTDLTISDAQRHRSNSRSSSTADNAGHESSLINSVSRNMALRTDSQALNSATDSNMNTDNATPSYSADRNSSSTNTVTGTYADAVSVRSETVRSRDETSNSISRVAMTGSSSSGEAVTGSSSPREAVTGSRRTSGAARSSRTSRAANDEYVEEGFTQVTNRRRNNKSKFTGRKKGTNLRSVQQVRNIRLFVSRLEAGLSADILKDFICELIGDECSVSKLTTKYPTYSSFLVICDERHKEAIMNPEEWEEGVLVMKYFNRTGSSMRSSPNLVPNSASNGRNE